MFLDRINHALSWIVKTIWSLFLNGLMTILPLALTVVIFNVSFKLIKGWLEPLQKLDLPLLSWIPHYEIIVVIGSILILGAILKSLLLRTIVHSLESLIVRLPLVRPVYTGIKQLVLAFSSQEKITFKQVVMLEFPIEHLYSIGFLTSEIPSSLAPNTDKKYFSVFVPTTPNPTTGYFVVVPEDKIRVTQLTRQEAMALVISGGIVLPERFFEK